MKIFSQLIFAFVCVSILSIWSLSYWANYSIFTIPKYILLFLPRWWLIVVVLFLLTFWRHFNKAQLYILPLLIIGSLQYLDFQIPSVNIGDKAKVDQMKIITINMGEGSRISSLKRLVDYYEPDILLIQEISEWHLKGIFDDYWGVDCDSGLCIASKMPFERIHTFDRRMIGGWGNFAAIYHVDTSEGIINLVNVHFETPRQILLEILKRGRMSYLSKNKDENRQLEPSLLNREIAGLKNVIVAGDFNMPVDDIEYRRNFSWLTDAFNQKGFGLNHTQYIEWEGIPFLSFRIDHILFSDSFDIGEVDVLGGLGGDHRPILATFSFSE
jgi:endonuclease/exonuclease/phosphatase (EEP) superfamily protein YafD|tara:strand:+ start:4465 stop:5445 length:981 start_codon:yes stop_codon:yes gene_type:complete